MHEVPASPSLAHAAVVRRTMTDERTTEGDAYDDADVDADVVPTAAVVDGMCVVAVDTTM